MKALVLFSFLTIFPISLIGQTAHREAEFDSLSRPLPAGATVREQAEQCRTIMWYQFVHAAGDFSHWCARLDSLFQCCIAGKSGDRRYEKTIEADLDFYKGLKMWMAGQSPDSSRRIFESVLIKYTAIGDSLKMGWTHLAVSQNAIFLGDSLLFAKHYNQALRYSQFLKKRVDVRHFYMYCATQCRFFERYAESASHFFKILELVDKSSDWHATFIKAASLAGIAEIYYEIRDFDNAERYSRMAVQVGSEIKSHADSYYQLLGLIMIEKKAYKEALPILIKAEGCEACNSHPVYQSIILLAKATCYREMGDLKTALPLAKKAVQLTSIAMNVAVGAISLMELAECEFAFGRSGKALNHALASYETFVRSKNNWGKVRASGLLTTIYKSKGNYRKALEYSELHSQHQRQVERQQSNRQMALGEFTRDNAAQKARREAEVKTQLDQQRNIRYALFAGLGVLALLAFLLFNRYRYKQRTNEQLEAKNREVEAARRRAEASEAFKSRFLANMSHEIRTPLHGIAGYTDLVLETALTEKQRRYLSSIHHSTERLTEVVNDILDISKLEAGEVRLRQIPFSPARIALDVQETLSVRAGNKGIKLNVNIGEDVPAAALGDPTRLYQILMNLAGNAVKFTSVGSVQLAVGSPQPEDGLPAHPLTSLSFSVTDSGIGIPSEKLASIFDSFQQAGDDTTSRFGGTGLGLTIARELAQLHGSDIKVQSEVGKGSTFSFTLALPLANAAELEKTDSPFAGLYFSQSLKILLADDNEMNREIATEAIRRHFENAEIVEVVNGNEAVDLLEKQTFDLVLMDMQMPEMNGVEATRFIRQHLSEGKGAVPVIALTASATPDEIEKALESGMNRHLGKPFKPIELARVIAETLGLSASIIQEGPSHLINHHSSPITNYSSPITPDLTFLHDFCNGDKAQMRYFIQKFIEHCPLEINRLEDILREGDRETMYQAVHSFRPQLEFVGLKNAAALALLLEQGTREGVAIDQLNHLLAQIKKLLQELPKVADSLNEP